MEGWHLGCQTSLMGQRPTIWKFLEALQKEEQLQAKVVESVVAGNDVRKERPQDVKKTRNLLAIVADYQNRDRLDFLRGIAHNFAL